MDVAVANCMCRNVAAAEKRAREDAEEERKAEEVRRAEERRREEEAYMEARYDVICTKQ
jgi:hypothetical protein